METAFGFVDSYWENITYMFDDTGIDEEVQEILIKTILYNVITKRNKIDSVKSGVNLGDFKASALKRDYLSAR